MITVALKFPKSHINHTGIVKEIFEPFDSNGQMLFSIFNVCKCHLIFPALVFPVWKVQLCKKGKTYYKTTSNIIKYNSLYISPSDTLIMMAFLIRLNITAGKKIFTNHGMNFIQVWSQNCLSCVIIIILCTQFFHRGKVTCWTLGVQVPQSLSAQVRHNGTVCKQSRDC